MPFDAPPSRLGPLPDIAGPVTQPQPAVFPIGDLVQQGVNNVDKIIQEFSPLSRAEKAAKIAQFAYIRAAYEAGMKGDTSMLQQIVGHATHQLTPQEIFQRNRAAALGRTSVTGLPKGSVNEVDPVRQSRIIALQKAQAGASSELTQPQPKGRLDTMSASLNPTLDESSYPPVNQ